LGSWNDDVFRGSANDYTLLSCNRIEHARADRRRRPCQAATPRDAIRIGRELRRALIATLTYPLK
jgi:hypothetical protein